MTFDDFCKDFRVTPAERNALVQFLALLRYRRTLEALS